MKDFTAIIINFFYDLCQNPYLGCAILGLLFLLLNSSLLMLSMRNVKLKDVMEKQIAEIHDKYGYSGETSKRKIQEIITLNNYVLLAPLFVTALQLLETIIFSLGCTSENIVAGMNPSEGLNFCHSLYQVSQHGIEYVSYYAIVILVAIVLQRVNDTIIEDNSIADQKIVDYVSLIFVAIALCLVPTYGAIMWIASEVGELAFTLYTIKDKEKHPAKIEKYDREKDAPKHKKRSRSSWRHL